MLPLLCCGFYKKGRRAQSLNVLYANRQLEEALSLQHVFLW